MEGAYQTQMVSSSTNTLNHKSTGELLKMHDEPSDGDLAMLSEDQQAATAKKKKRRRKNKNKRKDNKKATDNDNEGGGGLDEGEEQEMDGSGGM